jgi:hypothetical protein
MIDAIAKRRRELGRSPSNHHGPEENIMAISAWCLFCGEIPGNNPDAAAEALRAAGYEVFRLPPELQDATCEIEGDDFIEVRCEGVADDDAIGAMWADAQRIVAPFKGDVDCVGAASEEPFFKLTARWRPFCAHCMQPGTPARLLLSINVGQCHVLLHNDGCLRPWLDTLIKAGPRLDTLVQAEIDTPVEEEF